MELARVFTSFGLDLCLCDVDTVWITGGHGFCLGRKHFCAVRYHFFVLSSGIMWRPVGRASACAMGRRLMSVAGMVYIYVSEITFWGIEK